MSKVGCVPPQHWPRLASFGGPVKRGFSSPLGSRSAPAVIILGGTASVTSRASHRGEDCDRAAVAVPARAHLLPSAQRLERPAVSGMTFAESRGSSCIQASAKTGRAQTADVGIDVHRSGRARPVAPILPRHRGRGRPTLMIPVGSSDFPVGTTCHCLVNLTVPPRECPQSHRSPRRGAPPAWPTARRNAGPAAGPVPCRRSPRHGGGG